MIFEKQVVNAYKSMMYTRCDDTETVFYFSAKDFPGLLAEEYTFLSSLGHKLKGYIYSYGEVIEGRIIVFDHGFGGGHRAYMKEIEMLCRHGYLVFAYDHTGCMESGGETAGGLARSLCDLNDCITAIKGDSRFAGLDISVMGHSWGGFSTLNITALHPEISHIVAMCGFVSVEEMMKTFFSGPLKIYRKAVLEVEKQSNPEYFSYNAVESLAASDVKALLIYSEDDRMCRITHYNILKAGLEGRGNVKFLLEKNKGHNPNYTHDAVKLHGAFVKSRAKVTGKKVSAEKKANFVASCDWNGMTVQDEEVWKKIFAHLDDKSY